MPITIEPTPKEQWITDHIAEYLRIRGLKPISKQARYRIKSIVNGLLACLYNGEDIGLVARVHCHPATNPLRNVAYKMFQSRFIERFEGPKVEPWISEPTEYGSVPLEVPRFETCKIALPPVWRTVEVINPRDVYFRTDALTRDEERLVNAAGDGSVYQLGCGCHQGLSVYSVGVFEGHDHCHDCEQWKCLDCFNHVDVYDSDDDCPLSMCDDCRE